MVLRNRAVFTIEYTHCLFLKFIFSNNYTCLQNLQGNPALPCDPKGNLQMTMVVQPANNYKIQRFVCQGKKLRLLLKLSSSIRSKIIEFMQTIKKKADTLIRPVNIRMPYYLTSTIFLVSEYFPAFNS